MTERPDFDKQYVEGELQKFALKLRKKTRIYVAGGAAMASSSEPLLVN